MNALSQLIHSLEVFLPEVIKGEEHHLLFEAPHHGLAHLGRLLGIVLSKLIEEPRLQPFPIKILVLSKPLGHGLLAGKFPTQRCF